MQEKSAEISTVADRLQRLRVKTQLTWVGVAELLKISTSMIYQVRAGKNQLSEKALYRLQNAEVDAGLATFQDISWERLLTPEVIAKAESAVAADRLSKLRVAKLSVSPSDMRKGFKLVPVDYKFQDASASRPKSLRVNAIPSLDASRLVPLVRSKKDFESVLLACLESKYKMDSFLNLLDPVSISSLIKAAFMLSFGEKTGKELLIHLGYEID